MKILLKTDRNTKKHSNIDNVCSNLLFAYCFMKILPVLVLFCFVNIWLLYLCDNQHFLQVLFVGLLMILKQYNINHVNTSISCSTCSQPSCTIIISVIFILLSMYIKFNQLLIVITNTNLTVLSTSCICFIFYVISYVELENLHYFFFLCANIRNYCIIRKLFSCNLFYSVLKLQTNCVFYNKLLFSYCDFFVICFEILVQTL